MKTLVFVDDESRVLQGLQRQLRPMRNEWDMQFLDGGQKALDFMNAREVDVIVSDMMMPGMDGAQLLTEVSKRFPHTVRIVLSGHADREAVLRLVGPAHQYLSKPCDAEELRNAVARAFALRDLLSNEKLKQLAAKTKCLPSLPSLYTQLTDALRDEDADIEKIGEIISKDVGMTTKILQLVNSAFFGLPQPLNNPTEAVMYLGLTTVRSLVLSLKVFSQFDEKSTAGFSLDALADHCWRTAVLARRIAKSERQDEKMCEQCFVGGLLHDVGRLVLITGLPEDYAQVLRSAKEQNLPLWQAEQTQFNATHAEVGAYLLGLWALPNLVIEAVALHHRPAHSVAREFSPVVAVHVANAFAHGWTTADAGSIDGLMDVAHLTTLGLATRIPAWQEVCVAAAKE